MDFDEKVRSSLGLSDLLKLVSESPEQVTVVTVNNRLTRFLKERYSLLQLSKGKVWNTPDILTLNAWVMRLWNRAQLVPIADCDGDLLDEQSEQWLWTLLIQEYVVRNPKKRIAMVTQAASDAINAWRMLHEARAPLDFLQDAIDRVENDGYVDETKLTKKTPTYIFAELANIHAVKYSKYVTLAEIMSCLSSEEMLDKLSLPKTVIFAGFTELLSTNMVVPKHRAPYEYPTLLQDFRRFVEQVCTVQEYYVPDPRGAVRKPTVRSYQTSGSELIHAAQWAKEQMSSSAEKPLRIGIVIPDLHNRLREVESVFTSELCPSLYTFKYLGQDYASSRRKVFNISVGAPFGQQSAVSDAIALLRLMCGVEGAGVDFETVSQILLSRWFSDTKSGYLSRLSLERRLRQSGRREYLASDFNELKCTDSELIRSINICCNKAENEWIGIANRGKKLPSYWAEKFKTVLHDVKWLGSLKGESRFDLKAYAKRIRQSFETVLDGLSSYDIFDTAAVTSATEALDMIKTMADTTPFQMAGGDGAPVQILGLLEMAGQEFTHLWVCGMDDKTWPSFSRLNPLLTISLQRY
ncbi:MAG: hypothetical protein PHX74_11750, partial [Candidatus Sumerlaeales bacterium]|nr:hypothetical protein [Candidatus Sumerlaeales bacterium]